MSIYSLVPDAKALLELEPEELAGVVMEYLNSLEQESLSRHNFTHESTVEEYPVEARAELRQALMEAWVWLEREGLLVPKPGSESWVVISRRGRQLRTHDQVRSYRHANLLQMVELVRAARPPRS